MCTTGQACVHDTRQIHVGFAPAESISTPLAYWCPVIRLPAARSAAWILLAAKTVKSNPSTFSTHFSTTDRVHGLSHPKTDCTFFLKKNFTDSKCGKGKSLSNEHRDETGLRVLLPWPAGVVGVGSWVAIDDRLTRHANGLQLVPRPEAHVGIVVSPLGSRPPRTRRGQ